MYVSHPTMNVATTSNGLTEDDLKQIIGRWYDTRDSEACHASKAYQVISRINNHWYDMIPVEVVWQEKDPYNSYADMRHTVETEGKLRVFSGGSNPKYMSHEDNIRGRAVHDWFGHLERGCDFSLEGEWKKYYHVKDRYPQWVRPLLFTEIVGQRAAASFYPNGFTDSRFEQKSVFAPCHLREMCRRAFGDDK